MEKGISSLFLSLLTETSETRTSYHSDRVRAGGGALQICASTTRARLETNSRCTPTSGGKESEFRAPYCRGCKWTQPRVERGKSDAVWSQGRLQRGKPGLSGLWLLYSELVSKARRTVASWSAQLQNSVFTGSEDGSLP